MQGWVAAAPSPRAAAGRGQRSAPRAARGRAGLHAVPPPSRDRGRAASRGRPVPEGQRPPCAGPRQRRFVRSPRGQARLGAARQVSAPRHLLPGGTRLCCAVLCCRGAPLAAAPWESRGVRLLESRSGAAEFLYVSVSVCTYRYVLWYAEDHNPTCISVSVCCLFRPQLLLRSDFSSLNRASRFAGVSLSEPEQKRFKIVSDEGCKRKVF